MDLATHQRALERLFSGCSEDSTADDAYVERVARSADLKEAKRNILLWRIYVLERTAPLTFKLLKQRNALKGAVEKFIASRNISPFRETHAPAFLNMLSSDPDHLVRSVAQFENAFLSVKQGDPSEHVVQWHADPHPVLYSLATDSEVPDDPAKGSFRVILSREYPGLFKIARC